LNSHDSNLYANKRGIVGWLTGGRHGFEGYLYLLHRISGVALLLFLTLHVFVTSSRLFGEAAWERVMGLTHHPAVRFLEFLVYAAFAFHALNGVRLLLIEFGFAVGKPSRPVFPYKSSLHSQRKLMIGLMIVTGLLIALGGFELLRLPQS
jgi:succinate dehydrogenase / fumarate reductase cytochrome b subunit